MTTKQTSKNRKGFAIAATLAVGVALSLVVSVLLVKGGETVDDVAVRLAAEQFDGVYKSARALAVKSGRTAEIRIDGTRIWVQVDTTSAGTGERTRVGRVTNLDFIGVALDATTTSLCFDSSGLGNVRGRCSVAGGRIEFSKGNSVKAVATTATTVIPG